MHKGITTVIQPIMLMSTPKTVIKLLQPTILMVMEGGQEANSIMIIKVI